MATKSKKSKAKKMRADAALAEPETINCATKDGVLELQHTNQEGKLPDVFDYFAKGTGSKYIFKGSPVFRNPDPDHSEDPIVVVDGIVHFAADEQFDDLTKGIPVGVIVPKPACCKKNVKFFPVLNGDGDHNDLVEDNDGFPTVSFECIARFYADEKNAKTTGMTDKDIVPVVKRMTKGEIIVVDYTCDQTKDMSQKDKEAQARWRKSPKKNNPPKPPEAGFTIVGNKWHRSGTVVLLDTKKNVAYLIGQDENSYFGVELPSVPKSVGEAFEILTPEPARRSDALRQGEWFLVPVTQVPDPKDCLLLFDDTDKKHRHLRIGNVWMPVDTDDSSKHWLQTGDGRVGKDGVVYAFNPTLSHENGDHADVDGEGWFAIYKNTAVRAFSAQGVD